MTPAIFQVENSVTSACHYITLHVIKLTSMFDNKIWYPVFAKHYERIIHMLVKNIPQFRENWNCC